MRTDKELLGILLENMNRLTHGLCGLAHSLYLNYTIEFVELERISSLLLKNKPENSKSFYFPTGEKEPRIEFLQRLINEL